MHRCLPACVLALLGVALLALSGCASSPPTRLYVVPSLTDTATAPPLAPHDLTLGVAPVTLPPYLDRPQIVTRAGRSRLVLAEFDQWAAPLQDTVARVLAENLSLLIPTDRVLLSPWPRTMAIDYQVMVEVTQFERTMGGEVVLVARWRIAAADGQELMRRTARFSTPAGGQDYEATVTAMSRTLEALSRDMAATVQSLVQQAPAREAYRSRNNATREESAVELSPPGGS